MHMSSKKAVAVWAALCTLTIASLVLAAVSADGPAARNTYHGMVVLLVLVKARLVMTHFMAAKDGPRALRLTCDATLLLMALAVAAPYATGVTT